MATLYRADQVGSLLRPPELLEARAAHAEGQIDLDQLRQIEDEAILDALELQRQVGLDVFTDGEYRRSLFLASFFEAVEGFGPTFDRQWRGSQSEMALPAQVRAVAGKLRKLRRITAHESAFLKEHSPGPYKVTLPSAGFMTERTYQRGLTDQFYPTFSDLLRDMVGIVQGEVQALADEGVPYIQLDAPGYTRYVDQRVRQEMRDVGWDPDQMATEAIEADNASLEGAKREGVTLAAHLCRGNNRSQWRQEGGYDPIAEKLFNSLQVDVFLLEYDSQRAGGFEPLRFVPRGKSVVLGLVTTKEGKLESQGQLLRQIDAASKYVPLENLAISPQCGFATVAAGNLISWDDQRRKLELVVDTARKVWG